MDDLADACLFLMENYDGSEIVNIGWGEDLTIAELASLVAKVVGCDGPIVWDDLKPDGTPRKLLDASRLSSLGWKPVTSLKEGIRQVYNIYTVSSDHQKRI